MLTNFALRAHNSNWDLDPEVRSLLDLDVYKLLMAQLIWKRHRDVPVTFGLINRTKKVRLAEVIPIEVLRAHLNHTRSLRARKSELIWLAGNTFYGVRGIFEPGFLEWFASYSLPDYELRVVDGQYELTFSGRWLDVTLWEIYALAVVAGLKTRAALAGMSEFELDILYARAKAKIWEKIKALKTEPGIRLADFGTRRRHSFLWQEYVVTAMQAELGQSFIGTSNAYLAMKHDMEAIGTNAHELPMAFAAMAGDDDAALVQAQYRVLEEWAETYAGNLLVALPDTFGTTQFLAGAPDWLADWSGIRPDSKEPVEAGEEYIRWLESRGRDPRTKRVLFSDGLDVEDILRLHRHFRGRILDGYGWGTLLTNDFRGCHPRDLNTLEPISLVCKVTRAAGRPAVKLSDNYTKATGTPDEVARYRGLFGVAGVANAPVTV